MSASNRTELFATVPVKKAVMTLILPTIISQIITIIYNLADIFFVGQLGDPNMVAAVSLVMPAFMLLTATGNLFGIGGASAISRALGAGDEARARRISAFCFWSALSFMAVLSLLIFAFGEPLLRLLGASDFTVGFALQYVRFVLVLGGIPTALSIALAHMIRADGGAKYAGMGLSMGGLLNIGLDALFVLVFRWGVAGAAFATMLSNAVSMAFFLLYLYRRRANTILSIAPRQYSLEKAVCSPVFAAGFPAAMQTFLVSLFYMFINRLASGYSDVAVAAIGIVQKLDMVPQYVTLGISQGVLPLLGYNYAAKNLDRMHKSYVFAMTVAAGFSLVCVAVFELFAGPLVQLFLDDPATIALGTKALRIMCLAVFPMAICNVTNSVFQGAGMAKEALGFALFRRLVFAVPVLYLMDAVLPLTGIFCTPPIVDVVCIGVSQWMYRRFLAKNAA